MLVGVDHIPSRWIAQRARPAWLGVGATADFLAVSSAHAASHMRGWGCAGCLYPVDDGVNLPIPTVSFVSYLAGLAIAARLVAQVRGAQRSGQGQALFMGTLRLDLPGAQWIQPVPLHAGCPVDRDVSSKEASRLAS